MNRQDIATLAFRILGIFISLRPVQSVLTFFTYLFSGFSTHMDIQEFLGGPVLMLLLTIIFEGAVIAVGVLCFLKSRQLAKWTFPDTAPQPMETTQITSSEAQELAFSVIGLWFLCLGLAEFAQGLIHVWAAIHADALIRTMPGFVEGWIQRLVTPATYLIIGAVLFFRYKDVIAFWQRWRRTGSTD